MSQYDIEKEVNNIVIRDFTIYATHKVGKKKRLVGISWLAIVCAILFEH